MKIWFRNDALQEYIACNLWLSKIFPFLRWWPQVNRRSTRADLLAGLTGAIIVLPQGVAFATIAGLPPQYGLYAAMVPTVIAALFGSSKHLVSGPTTAISIVVFASISPLAEPGSSEYISMVLTLTFLVGVFQLVMGMARMGALVNFISHTVVIGFTAGAALLIIASQIKNFFGIDIERGASFSEVLIGFVDEIPHINWYVTAVALVTLLSGIAFRRFVPKVPYLIGAMVAGSLFALLLDKLFGPAHTDIQTVGSLPAGLPPLSLPDFSPQTIKVTISSALAVMILALTEAVSIARSIAIKSEQRIDANQEFIGQGLSNMFGSFFSGYAASGSFNRSGLNYESGAKTPLAAVFSALFLVLIVLAVAPLAEYLPIAAMAGVLFLVAYALIDFEHIFAILKTSRQESAVLLMTLFSALFAELEFAIFVGVILSLMLYLNRTSKPSLTPLIPNVEEATRQLVANRKQAPECPQMKIVRLDGSLFFGAVSHVQQALQAIDEINPRQKSVLVVGSGINIIDVAGAEMLVQESRRRRSIGGDLYLCRIKESACSTLKKGHYLEHIGRENVFNTESVAIRDIYSKLDSEICRNCSVRIFKECHIALPSGEPRPDTAEAYHQLGARET